MSAIAPAAWADYLRQLPQNPERSDDATERQVLDWLARHPRTATDLVQRAMAMEGELIAARDELTRLRRDAEDPQAIALRRQSQVWDLVLGTSPGAAQPAAAPRRRSFEDIGAAFLARHAAKVWLVLFALCAVVVAVREGLV